MEHAPITYVSDHFLDRLGSRRDELSQLSEISNFEELIPNELKSKERILTLLLNSIVITDLNENDLIDLRIWFKKLGSKGINNCKEAVYFKAIKSNRLKLSQFTFFKSSREEDLVNADLLMQSTLKYNAIYFLDDNQANCRKASLKYGLSSYGKDYDFKDFFSAASVANYGITPELEELKELHLDANSLVIIDKYIFCDSTSKSPKIPNVINAVKAFMNESLGIKFQLDILTENNNNNKLFSKKANELLAGLGGSDKISIHIYSPISLKENDRFLLTNYSFINLGHPFDRASFMSSSIYLSQENKENLISAYCIWRKKLEFAKLVSISTPRKLGLINCVFKTDEETHRLFNLNEN